MTTGKSTVVTRIGAFAKRRKGWLAGVALAVMAYAILGFFVMPWAVTRIAVDSVNSNLNAELRLDRVSINPFVMSLTIEGLALDESSGAPLVRIERVFANFQLSSIFRWAWTFRDLRFDGPEVFLSRDDRGALNVSTIVATAPESPPPASEDPGGMPRLFIYAFSVNDARVDWRDELPAEAVATVFGPVSIRIADLNTLPQRAGRQEVVITTETQGTFGWSGSLQLNPFNSAGRATVRGSHFPLLSAYIRNETGVDIVDGVADVGLDYAVSTGAGGQAVASIDNLDVRLTDIGVNTFHAEPDADRQAREFLGIQEVAVRGGSLRWPAREVRIDEFSIDGVNLDLLRIETGEFDFAERAAQQDRAEEPTAKGGESEWSFAMNRLAVTRLAASLVDRSVSPVADIGVDQVDLEMLDISNEPGASFPTSISLAPRGGGAVRLRGSIAALPSPVVDLELQVENLALAAAHPYIRPLADINLDSGSLNLGGSLRHASNEPLRLEIDVEIIDFLLTETDAGTRLGSWDRLFAERLVLDAGDGALEISELRFDRPYADILIASDGTVNLGRVGKESVDDSRAQAAEEAAATTDEPVAAGWSTTIGRVVIDDASAAFADESLPLPFSAQISGLNGTLSTIATDSEEPSTVELEGAVDEFGLVRVTGSVTPLEFARNTDLLVTFQNVEMPKFSAYTIPFAGQEIASGRLDVDLGYEVNDGRLVGENRIVLRDFELGEKVEHPGAASLPLGLAVALLKDASGKIDIDLPVRGDLDDPEFGYGRVIGKALANLVVKIVASPFALLGNLVGVEADELEYLNFRAGRSDLSPPELERVQKLSEALSLRPELVLEISGVVDREADGLAIRSRRVDEEIDARLEAARVEQVAANSDASLRLEITETMYRESLAADPAVFDELRASFTTMQPDETTGEELERFDSLAYTNELRRQLIANETVDEATLAELARSRGESSLEAILAVDPALQGRVSLVGLREEEPDGSDDVVRMKVSLAPAGRDQVPR